MILLYHFLPLFVLEPAPIPAPEFQGEMAIHREVIKVRSVDSLSGMAFFWCTKGTTGTSPLIVATVLDISWYTIREIKSVPQGTRCTNPLIRGVPPITPLEFAFVGIRGIEDGPKKDLTFFSMQYKSICTR